MFRVHIASPTMIFSRLSNQSILLYRELGGAGKYGGQSRRLVVVLLCGVGARPGQVLRRVDLEPGIGQSRNREFPEPVISLTRLLVF